MPNQPGELTNSMQHNIGIEVTGHPVMNFAPADCAHRRRRGGLPGRGRRAEGEGGAPQAAGGEEGDTGVQEVPGSKGGITSWPS